MSLVVLLCLVVFSPQTRADSLDADGSTTSFNFSAGELKQKNFRANSGDVVVFAFSNSASASVNFDIILPDGKLECGYGGCFTGASKDQTSLHYIRAKQTGTYAITFNLREATASGTVRLSVWNANQYAIPVKSTVTQVNFSTSEILKVISIPTISGQPHTFGLANRANSTVNYDVYGKSDGRLCGYGGCFTGPTAGSTTLKTFTPEGTGSGFVYLALLLRGANASGNVSVSLPSFTGTSATPSSSPTASPSISGSSTNSADSKVQTSVDQATRLASVATDAAVNLNTNAFNEKAYKDALDTINKAIASANNAVEKAKDAAKNAKDSAKDAAESQVKAAEKALEAAKSAKQAASEAKSINSTISGIKDALKNTQISQVKSSSKSCEVTVAALAGALGVAGVVATAGTAAPLVLATGAAATSVLGAALC